MTAICALAQDSDGQLWVGYSPW
ncbi:two-component regulator propeller domain-containing protein [Pseudomonas sp. GM74]